MDDAERCSRTTSSASSSSVSAAAAAVEVEVEVEERSSRGDRMVKMEMEAAEVLAGLANWGSESSGRIWGSKGKRASTPRVKTQSPANDSGNGPSCSAPRSLDLAEDQAAVDKLCSKKSYTNVMIKTADAGQDIELPKSHSTSTRSYASCRVGRSRQNLSEAEKEARRLRRVLANRESARQTIRRRQALYEELTRKAADLAWENQNLKREKELAEGEYQSLKNTNECLQARVAKTTKVKVDEPLRGEFKLPFTFQVVKTVKAEAEEAPGDLKLLGGGGVETCTSSTTGCPLLLYNQPTYSPFIWPPSIIQSPNTIPSPNESRGVVFAPSQVPLPSPGQPGLSQDQFKPLNIHGPTYPLHILPNPWFFHLPRLQCEFQSQFLFTSNDKKDETPTNNRHGASSSKTVAPIEDPQSTEAKASSLAEASMTANSNLHEAWFGLTLDIGGHGAAVPKPTGMVAVKCENRLQSDCVLNSKANFLSTALNSSFTDKYPIDSSRKVVGAIAAAEMRKRRKELTKLKNLHSRHC